MGLLIAILTIDGMAHVQLLSCIAIALTSIEVDTCPNGFFTLSPLPPTLSSTGATATTTATAASSPGGRRTVAKTYAGKLRLIAIEIFLFDFFFFLLRLVLLSVSGSLMPHRCVPVRIDAC